MKTKHNYSCKGLILMTAATLVSSLPALAQSQSKSTVRIKKVETVNGVRKVTDTTFTADDANRIVMNGGTIDISSLPGMDADSLAGSIVRSQARIRKMDGSSSDLDQEIELEIQSAMKAAGVSDSIAQKLMIIKQGAAAGNTKNVQVMKTVVQIIDIQEPEAGDMKRLGSSGSSDQKLRVKSMSFYPNPNNGKFNLSFSLADKGDAEVTIMSAEGKTVYRESLPDFSGNYDKEIDISKQARGIYFVKLEQGRHSQVRKIVLE